jgi:hypothetical protein
LLAVVVYRAPFKVPAPTKGGHLTHPLAPDLGREQRAEAKRRHQKRTVSWLTSMPRSWGRSSAFPAEREIRTGSVTASQMISSEVRKYRKELRWVVPARVAGAHCPAQAASA